MFCKRSFFYFRLCEKQKYSKETDRHQIEVSGKLFVSYLCLSKGILLQLIVANCRIDFFFFFQFQTFSIFQSKKNPLIVPFFHHLERKNHLNRPNPKTWIPAKYKISPCHDRPRFASQLAETHRSKGNKHPLIAFQRVWANGEANGSHSWQSEAEH